LLAADFLETITLTGTRMYVLAVIEHASRRIGSVKTPKQIEVWPDLPRSKVGKILKNDLKVKLVSHQA
jgi:acyl-coenzyme A synthetase/AMP-(fatty) acid ligase